MLFIPRIFTNPNVQVLLLLVNLIILGFLGGSDGKVSTCNAGDPSSIPASRRNAN